MMVGSPCYIFLLLVTALVARTGARTRARIADRASRAQQFKKNLEAR